jgi:hypothetical protein
LIRSALIRSYRSLALKAQDDPPLPLTVRAAMLLFHLGGILFVARLAHWPPLVTLAALLGALALSVGIRNCELGIRNYELRIRNSAFRIPHSAFTLTPLALAYLVALLRVVVAVADRLSAVSFLSPFPFFPLVVPPPWGDWLNMNWAFALGALWAAAGRLPASRRMPAAAAGLTALAFGWAGFVYFRSAPAGVTGSDPYAYVQMAVDLAERGTLLHAFPLAGAVRELGLPLYPVVHVGYRVPNEANLSATVWPPGFSALLAGAYGLIGERGLYWLNPALGLLSIAATSWLALILARDHPQRWAVAALAGFWLATSPEQTTRLLIPLADVAAQLFTTLALCLALLANHGLRTTDYELRFSASARAWIIAALAGIAFGWAYFTRYTQLLIAPALAFLLLIGRCSTAPDQIHRRQRGERRETFVHSAFSARFAVTALALFGLGAACVALPDLLYRQAAFGSPFAVGSEELGLFRLEAMAAMAAGLARELFASGEFLWALPLIALGGVWMWRGERRSLVALALAFGPLVLFHLPYPYLRLRDLLSLFPALAVVGALGAVEAARWLLARSDGLRIVAVALILIVPLARWHAMWPFADGFYTFGYLSAEQRAGLEHLAEVTPEEAVIAASLNSGAIELYASRATVRPATWSDDEFERFLAAMQAAGREVYLLDDGLELQPAVERLRAEDRLSEAARLPGVYYVVGGGSRNIDLPLYRIKD